MNAIPPAEKVAGLAWHQLEKAWAFLDRAAQRTTIKLRGQGADEREAAHWSRPGGAAILSWQDHPVIRAHINRRVSGDPEVNWLSFFAREFGNAGFESALNLGCGFGDLEAHAFALGLVKKFYSLDLSAGAIAAARERLRGRSVEFEVTDINQLELEPEAYDAVFASSSLHHLVRLERVLDEVRKGLKPGGLFVFNEYVGPSRMQWQEEQLRIVNELLAALAPRYRRNLRKGYGYKRRVYRPPLDERDRNSPFEAARSAEIVPLTFQRYDIVIKRDYGGALLHPLLDGIAGNFMDNPKDAGLLQRLARLEEELEGAGIIGSDFTMIVARPR